jgi:hypothetical protein
MKPLIRRLSVALSLLSFVVMVLACAARPAPRPPNNPPAPNAGNPDGNKPPVPRPPEPPPADKPDAEMTAVQYQLAFSGKGGWDSYQRYKDQYIKVTGKVGGYGYDLKGVGLLSLDQNTKFACEEQRPMTKALPGQTVVLRGKPTGMFGVEKWAIVSVAGDPPPTVDAEQLLQDLKRDKAGTDAKWKGKAMILSGKLTKDYKNGGVMFSPPNQQPYLGAWFYDSGSAEVNRARFDPLKASRTVKLVGWYEGNGSLGIAEPIEVLP